MATRLIRLLEGVLHEQFGGVKQRLARAIGVTPSRLGRVMQGEFSLSVLSCLRLARVSGRDPGTVLQAAGKEDLASLLEALYGKAVTPLPTHEHDLIERWRRLRPDSREVLSSLIDDLNRVQGRSAKRKNSA